MVFTVNVETSRLVHLLALVAGSTAIGLLLQYYFDWNRLTSFSLGVGLVTQVNAALLKYNEEQDAARAEADRRAAKAKVKSEGLNPKKNK
jgi:hypothetical protein